MRFSRLTWAGPLGLILIALIPAAGAMAPVNGTVTTCTSTSACAFVFNTSAGTGWATTTNKVISFQLPGEAKASYNVSYSTYIARLTGTYTYWTVGNFLGTDSNSGKVVFGTTNTNYTITCHGHSGRGGGCTYTYTTDNGTIVFHFTQAEQTSTAVSCSPSGVTVPGQTTCTATVTNLWNASHVPTGKIHFSSQGLGSFASHGNCNLTAGACSLKWTPFDNTVGSVTISANFYARGTAFYKSSSSTVVGVINGD
jgi:hypothetical protein